VATDDSLRFKAPPDFSRNDTEGKAKLIKWAREKEFTKGERWAMRELEE